MCVLISLYAGGDEGLGEAGAERGVLLPDRERGTVQLSCVQSDRSAAESGPGSSQRRPGPANIQPRPAAQAEDRGADTSNGRLLRLSLGRQGGEGRHVRPNISPSSVIHLFFLHCRRSLTGSQSKAALALFWQNLKKY